MRHKHALVLGKFHNPHKGHIALMKYAASIADKLTVLVCDTGNAPVYVGTRVRWIEEELFANPNIEVMVLDTADMCQREDSNMETSKEYADVIMEAYPTVDVFVGSEQYIHMMAEAADIDGIVYDRDRTQNPYSSTKVREGAFEGYCSAAKMNLVRTIHVVGPESTGKTELCKRLAKHFNCDWVPETQREWFEMVDPSGYYTPDMLIQGILMQSAARISKIRKAKTPLLIVDSDSITTRAYAHQTFGHAPTLITQVCKTERPTLTLVCAPTVEFVQDGTRLNEKKREKLYQSMSDMCRTFRPGKYVRITADYYEERFNQAVRAIDNVIS